MDEDDAETVLTSRRAWLRGEAGVVACRLRLTDTRLELAPTAAEPPMVAVRLCDVVTIRAVVPLRRLIEVETAAQRIRFRCFGAPAIAGLIAGAVERAR